MVEYTNNKLELSIRFEEQLITSLYEYGMDYYPKEFGGVLLGHYSGNRKLLNVTNTILPMEFESSPAGFERGIKGLQKELDALRVIQPLTKYVGEWHTHPDMAAIPSKTDKTAMNNIAADPKCSITNPVLLIISNNKKDFTYKFYVQYENQLYPFNDAPN